jgi:hypothetical protein
MTKRKDECLFCSSRSCKERIVTSTDKGKAYDEIACIKYVKDLYAHSDKTVPGTERIFRSSTGNQRRGDLSIFERHERGGAYDQEKRD